MNLIILIIIIIIVVKISNKKKKLDMERKIKALAKEKNKISQKYAPILEVLKEVSNIKEVEGELNQNIDEEKLKYSLKEIKKDFLETETNVNEKGDVFDRSQNSNLQQDLNSIFDSK